MDPAGPRYVEVCELPGFTLGLDFAGRVAFVGLSQVQESVVFAGLPLTDRLKERVCGVYAVHVGTGEVLACLHFTARAREVLAVQCLPGRLYPELLNEPTDLRRHAYVLADGAMADVAGPSAALEKTPGR